MSDSLLWTELKNGSQKALRDIYDQNMIRLESYARKFTQDTELIEDTIHDIFIQIWEKREGLGHTDSIIGYLCVTLRRELIRRLEKSAKTTGFEYAENKDINFQLSAEDLIIEGEQNDLHSVKLHEAFSQLSNRQKEAIFLKFYEEMNYDEICEAMDINYQSVRNLISKGIIEIRKFLGTVLIAGILLLGY